jgi:hypothetical protein
MSRLRRFRRGLVLLVLVLTLLTLVAAIGVRTYGNVRLREAERQFRHEVGPVDCASYAPPAVPDERNGANLLLGGAQAIVLEGDSATDAVARAIKDPPSSAWSTADLAALRAVLARNVAALNVLRAARDFPEANLRIPYRDGLQAQLPNLLQAIRAAKVLRADAALALMDGDLARALEDVETLGIQARAYSREPILIVHLIGTAIERQQLGAASLALSSAAADASALRRLRDALQDTDLAAAYRRALAFEAVGAGQAFRDPAMVQAEIGSSVVWFPSRAALEVVAPLAAAETLDRMRGWNAAFKGTKLDIDRQMALLPEERALLAGRGLAIPNVLNGMYRALGTQSLRRLAAAAIDLRLEALRTGRYPDALPPQHRGPEPLLGAPLRYARAADGSASLEIPGAEDVWKRHVPKPWTNTFRWSLPPPSLHP